jgi:hypothetical protein
MFVYHDTDRVDAMELSMGGGFLRRAEQLQLPSVGSWFDLVVHCHPALGSKATHLKMEYRSSLFHHEFMETMSRSINAALNGSVSYRKQRP